MGFSKMPKGWVNKSDSVRYSMWSIRLKSNGTFVGVAKNRRLNAIKVEIIKKVCQFFWLSFWNMGRVSLFCLLESLNLHTNDLRSSKRKKIDTPLLETFFPTSDVIYLVYNVYYCRSRGCTGINLEAKDFYWPWYLWRRELLTKDKLVYSSSDHL